MPLMRAGNVQREIACVVLDKDGTLIDHHAAWFDRYNDGVIAVVDAAGGGDPMRRALYRALAIDIDNRRFVADAPNKSLKIADHALMATTILHQSGCEWEAAYEIVSEHLLARLAAPVGREAIHGIGDIAGRLRAWKSAGIHLAILTNDNRASTLSDLSVLGIDHLFSVVVSADDGLAAKPAPDGMVHVARTLDIPLNRIAMIGDTTTDMLAAKAAGAGLVIGVLSGLDSARRLGESADAVVQDLHAVALSGQAD